MEEKIQWEKYPFVAQSLQGRKWLSIQAQLGLAPNTIDAYGRSLQDYLSYIASTAVGVESATREHIANYVHILVNRPNAKSKSMLVLGNEVGLANATLQQRLTVVRLFYDYLIEEGLRQDNPVGRGRFTRGHGFGGIRERGLIPKFEKMPWVPSEEQWQFVLFAAKEEPLRNQLMLAFSYDAALRREELCSLTTADLDPAHRMLRIRAETTKNRKERVVPYSETTALLYSAYLQERRGLSLNRGPVFLSASKRNYAAPISIWTWSKVVEGLAKRSGVKQFTTHTPRHLCLTDLARANWDIHQIALFAGHRSIQTTLLYIHLSGRDLKMRIEQGMNSIHASRIKLLGQLLP
jgi:integrase/recombinase XerD